MFANKALIIAVFCIAATVATPFKPCKVGVPPQALRIKGCDIEPCIFYRGETVVGEMDFTVAKNVEDLVPRFRATILGGLLTVPFPLPMKNVCESLKNSKCPMVAGKKITGGLEIPVLESYPKVSFVMEFSLLDKAGNVHVCFNTRAKVAEKKKNI